MTGLAGGASGPPGKLLVLLIVPLLLIPTVTPGSITTGSGGNQRIITQPKCASFCKESSKYGFRPGTTYRYNYRTDMSTFAIGAASQESRIQFTAAVELTPITLCELQLELKEIKFAESQSGNGKSQLPNSAELVHGLTQRPLRFSFQDGKVENICISADDEPTWVLNVKRGVLSTLQNTMEDLNKAQSLQENDVSGKCLTKYEVESNQGDSQVIKKSKNLKSCSQRHSHISAIQSVGYTSNSPIQNIPLLGGSQECTQTIRNRLLEKVECLEEHKFQPFEQASSGVTTVVSQSLVFESSRNAPAMKQEGKEYRKSSLIFEVQAAQEASDADIQEIMALLEKLERESVPKVSVFVPERFVELVAQLRQINYAALSSVYNKAPSDVARNFLLDAMPLVGTAPSLTFMRELFTAGKLTELQIDSWLTSITFIKHPRLDMISAIAPMLDGEPRNQALLAIGSVIHGYCRDHDNCAQEIQVQDALRKILSFLGPTCKLSKYGDQEMTRAMFALKAIGNAGRLPTENDDRYFQLLRKCFLDKTNPIEGRLAALDSFRRMPCDHYDQNPFTDLYKDMKEQTEVRIMAYLTAMRCPNRELIEAVKDTLYTDAVNQVGSFVWTHLTNLQETSSPDKQELKELLNNDFLKSKFNTDARKYSRNYESSLFWEDWNVGGGLDANVILTPDSFLPRSTTLNLTLFLFGESINLLEVGGRIHSFEQLLESIFGPEGYFPEPHVNEALNTVRSKRDTSNNEIERLGQVFHQAGINRDHLPGGSIFMRIFGHEISYKHFEFSHKQTAPSLVDETGKNWLDITYLFDNMGTGKQTEYIKSSILLDSSYTVPTGAGFPLTLGVQASSTVGMKASGKIDLVNFWENQEVDIHGALRPSGAIQVDGHLSIDIGKAGSKVRTGIKFQNTLHTATAIQARVLVKGTNVAHASLTLPEPKQEVLEVKSQLILISPSGQDVEVNGENSQESNLEFCSPDFLSTAIGLKFCGRAHLPEELSFPLLKPAVLSLSVEKTDTFNSYEFDYKWLGDEEGIRQDVSILFNTPGSTVDRRLAASYSLDTVQGKVELSIETPLKSLTGQGLYSKTAKNLQLTLRSNQEQILMVSTGLRRQMTRVEPHLLISYYSRPIVDAQGVLHLANILESDGKANFDMTLKHLTESPIQLTGEVTRTKELYDGRIAIESSLATGNIRSQLRLKPGLLSSKAEIQYSWKQSELRVINVGGRIQKLEKGAVVKYSAGGTLTSSQFPQWAIDFSSETALARGYCENNVKLLVGKSRWEGKTLFKNQVRRQAHDVQLLISLNAPQNGVDYHLEFTHQKNQSGILTKFTGRAETGKEIKAQAHYLRNGEKLLKRAFNAEVMWPGATYALKSGVTEVRAGQFEGELTIHPNGGSEKKATASYKNASNKRRQEHELTVRAHGFMSVPLSFSSTILASDRESSAKGHLQIEGRETYSGRWGGSFEYDASKRFAHKMEAKVDLNDKKYSAELNWRQARSGDQTYTADIHCTQHFYSELLLKKGDPKDVFWATVTVIPDKAFRPKDKVTIEGKLSQDAGRVKVDYFNQPMSLAGVYNRDEVKMEAEWESKRIAFSLATPSLTLEKMKVVGSLETPIEGYRNLGITIDHAYKGNSIESRVQGQLEGKTATLAIYGLLDNPQSTFSVALEASGMEKLALVAKTVNSGGQKWIEITTQKGVADTVFKAEMTELERSRVLKMDFSGCSFIPEVSMEYNRQKISEVTDTLVLRWTPAGSSQQQIEGRLSYLMNPLKMSFLVTSPWQSFDKVEGHFSIFDSEFNRELKLYVNGPAPALPLNFEVKLGGTTAEFGHSVSASWYSGGSKALQSLYFTATGRLASLDAGEFQLSAKIPNHRYQLDMSSRRDEGSGLQVSTKVTYDEEQLELGLGWLFANTDNIRTSAWILYPGRPKMIVSFEHLRRPDSYLLGMSGGLVGSAMGNLKVDLKQEGWMKWDMAASLSTPGNLIPDFDISSNHDLTNWKQVQHLTEFNVRQISDLWGGHDDQKGSFVFNILDGRQIQSSFSFNTKYVDIKGEIDEESKSINVKAVTPLFPTYDLTVGAQQAPIGGGVLSIQLNHDGQKLYFWEIHIVVDDTGVGGKLNSECPWGHVVEASGKLDWAKGLLELDLHETKQELINFKLRTELTDVIGRVELKVDGKGHRFLAKKILEAKYTLTSGKLVMDGHYEDAGGRSSLEGSGEYTNAIKKLEIKMSGKRQWAYTVEVAENRRLDITAAASGQRLFAISGEYDMDTRDYALGKHNVKLVVTTDKSQSFEAVIGLDMDKLLIQLDTPFDSWKHFMMTGEFKLEGSTNSASLSLRKDSSIYDLKVESSYGPGRGMVMATVTTPWAGYKRGNYKVQYAKDGEVMTGTVKGSLESSEILFRLHYSPTQAEFELVTPFEEYSKILLSAQWNLKGQSSKFLQLTATVNQLSHLGRITWDLNRTNGVAQLTLGGEQAGTADFKYDFRKSYNAEASLDFHGKKHRIGGQLVIDPQELRVELHTPFVILQNFGAKATHVRLGEGSHRVTLNWNLNGQEERIKGEATFRDRTVSFEGQFPMQAPWNLLKGQVSYDLTPEAKSVKIQAKRGDNAEFLLQTQLMSGGQVYGNTGNAHVVLEVLLQTPIDGWKEFQLDTNYDRAENKHTARIRIAKPTEILKSEVSLSLAGANSRETSISGSLALPKLRIQSKAKLTIKVDLGDETSVRAELTHNGVDYACDGAFQLNSSSFKIEASSSFSSMRKLLAAGSYAKLSDMTLTLQLNERVIDAKFQGAYDGLRHFKLNTDITTPFQGFRTLHGEAQLSIQENVNRGSFTLQNDRVRYMGKFEGQLGSDSGELRVQFNSPLYKLENVVWSLKYGSGKAMIRLERNTKEDVKFEAALEEGQLTLGLISNFPGYTMNTRSFIDWNRNPLSVQVNFDGQLSQGQEGLSIKCKIDGIHVGDIEIHTPYKGYENISLEWILDGTRSQGMAKLSYDLPIYGQRAFRSTWKHDNYKSLEAGLWWKENGSAERELSGQYSWASLKSGVVKFSGSVIYFRERAPQAVTISLSVKQNPEDGARLVDFSLKTPFASMEHLNLSGKIILGHDMAIEISSTLNKQTSMSLSGTLMASPLTSRLKVIFNAPIISEPFTLNAVYDLATPDKHVEVFFAQNKYKLNVKAQAIVPKENPQEIELRMSVDSNIPSVTVSASASLRAGYKIEADGTRQVTISVDSLQTGNWRAVASIRPRADFSVKIRLESPLPEVIPSIKSELGWSRTSQGLVADFIHQMGTHDINSRLTLTEGQFKVTMTSGYRGLEDVLLHGKLESGEGMINKRLEVLVKLAGKEIRITSTVLIPLKGKSESSIRLVSSWEFIPSATLEVSLEDDGVLSVHGNWGQKTVTVKGNFGSKKDMSLWKAAEVDMTLSMDSLELLRLQSHHLFHNNQYSWNVTLGNDLSLSVFLEQEGDRSVFSGGLKWDRDSSIRLTGELNKGRFTTTMSSPWANEIEVSGRYKVGDDEYSADGFITYDNVRSGLRAELLTQKDSIAAKLSVDVPVLGQKLDAKIHLQMTDKNQVVGQLEMSMGDRRVSVKGSLLTSHYPSSSFGSMTEKVLKVSIALPRSEFLEISTDWTLRRPDNAWHHAELEGTVALPKGTHKGAFRFDIPAESSNKLGAEWYVDTKFISPTILKGSFEVDKLSWKNFSGGLKYKENELKMTWVLDKNFLLDTSVHLPHLLHDSSPLRIEAEGVFDPAGELRIVSTFSANKESSTLEASLVQYPEGLNLRLFAHVPTLHPNKLELGFTVREFGVGRSVFEVSGSSGQESISAVGEFVHSATTLSATFKVSGSYGSHFIQLAGARKEGRYHFEINGESLNLFHGKKVNVAGNLSPSPGEVILSVQCRTKEATHGITVNIQYASQRGGILVTMEAPSLEPILFDASYILNQEKAEVKVLANMIEPHQFEILFDIKEKEGKLLVNCPLINSSPLRAHVRAKTEENHVSFIGDLELFGPRFRGEGTFRYESMKDMEAKIEVITPFDAFDRLTIGGRLGPDVVEIEFQTPVEDVPNFVLKSSGIKFFEANDFSNFHPKLTVGLPWVKYSAGGSFQLPSQTLSGKWGAMFEQEFPTEELERYEAYVNLTPHDNLRLDMDEPWQLTLKVNTPIDGFRHLECNIGGNVVWKTWADLRAEVHYNNRKIALVTQLRNEAGNRKLSIDFTSPFRNYDRLSLILHIQNYEEIGVGHNIELEFQRPGWSQPWLAEIDYRIQYNGLTDMNGELKLASPSGAIQPLLMRMRSEVKDSKYVGILEGTWGKHRPILALNLGMTPESLFGSLEGKMGEGNEYQFMTKVDTLMRNDRFYLLTEMMLHYNQIFLWTTDILREENLVEAEVRVKTPFDLLRSASAIYRLSPTKKHAVTLDNLLKYLDITAGATYNDQKLIHIELVNRAGKRVLEIHNPLRPVSISLGYDMSTAASSYAVAELCWDLTKAAESTIGFKVSMNAVGPGKSGNLKVHGGQLGFVELGVGHMYTDRKLDTKLSLKWNQPRAHGEGEAGYHVIWKQDTKMGLRKEELTLGLTAPWRSVEIETQLTSGTKGSSHSALIRWDVKRDPTKQVGYKVQNSKTTAWRSSVLKEIYTLIHPALSHDLSWSLERRYKNGAIQGVSVVFQPNPFPKDTLSLEFARDSIRNQELRFLASHPATNIDVSVHFKSTDGTTSLHLSHLDMLGIKQELNLEATSGIHGILLDATTATGPLLQLEYKPSLDQSKLFVKTPLMEMWGDLVNFPPLAKGVFKYDSGREMSFVAGLPHTKEITLKAARNEFGMSIRDFLVSFRLNASQILSTQVHWRPELAEDLRRVILTDLPRWVDKAIREDFPRFLSVVHHEIDARLTLIDPSLSQFFAKLHAYSREEIDMVVMEVNRVGEYIVAVHQNNTFHTQDILQLVELGLNKIYTKCADSIESIRDLVSAVLKVIRSGLERIKGFWNENGGRLEKAVMVLWDKAEQRLLGIWEELSGNFVGFLKYITETYETIGHIFNGNLDELAKTFKGLEIVGKVKKLYDDYTAWIKELPMQEYIEEAVQMFRERIWRPIELYYKPYFTALNSALEEGNIVALLDLPPLPYLRFLTSRILGIANRFWIFVEAEQKVKSLVRNILAKVDTIIQRHIPTATMVWELEKGHIEYHQPLTLVQWDHFMEVPQFKETPEDALDSLQIQNFYFDIVDTIRNTRPVFEMDIRDILPPFGATAVMAGDHHFLTFDGHYYRFSGECSYILVTDLLNQNFTLIINYDNSGGMPRKKSYSLMTGSSRVDIDVESLAVTRNGRKAELPLTVGPTFIRRQPSGLELIDTRGFQMKCSHGHNACTVSVSGWYFGKVGGLLGSYDNEEANDMKTPDGQLVTEVANFAHSWRVGPRSSQCPMKNYADTSKSDLGEEDLCHQMLNASTSPLRPCFQTVNVENYKRMCQYDIKHGHGEMEGLICTAVAAYVMQCQRQGVDIWMPPPCVKCRLEDHSEIRSGENMTYSPDHVRAPNSADVVLLIEEAASLREYNLEDALKKLESALRSEGIQNNRYAIIGYGGQGVRSKPHIRTSGGDVWSPMSSLKAHERSVMDGPGKGDLLEAIDYAAALGYRAGVSKTMIAIVPTNNECDDNGRYSDSLTLLLENDIRLHILVPEDFAMKIEKKQDETNKIFGVDLDGAFTVRQMKRGPIESDKALRRQVKMPKDLCTPLAMETSGTLFNLKLASLPATSKKFVDVWSRRVASTSKPSDCQLCECLPDREGGATTLCHPCISPNLQKFIDDLNRFEQNPEMDPSWTADGTPTN